VRLFGTLHIVLLGAIAAVVVALVTVSRKSAVARLRVRFTLGYGLVLNELIWWAFRYGHEGVHLRNLPLQLCDVTLWMTAIGCIMLIPRVVEFAYFAGLAGAGMALLTPDLWSPWPSYPAIYFFVAHGGIVAGIAVLVFGGAAPLRAGATRRAMAMLLGYAGLVGIFNAVFATNYMYLCRKPANASLLDALGPWPVYLVGSAILAFGLFWLLGLAARRAGGGFGLPESLL
jgi:hypothetical integral membrane protein (TIGR02206 family)